MDLRQLEYFVQIATLGGFNRASAHLYIAQSALSRQIKVLEEELGVTLLIRHRRGIELTPAGKLLLERADVLLRQFRQVRDDVVAEGGVPKGELVVGLPPSLQFLLAVPLIMKMHALYPSVFLRTWVATSMELKAMVLSGKLDFAVLGSFQSEQALSLQPLFRDEMLLVAPANAALPATDEIECADIADLPLILTSRPNSLRLLVDEAAGAIGKKLNVIMEVNYVPTLIDLVGNGLGYTLLSRSAFLGANHGAAVRTTKIRGLHCDWVIAMRKDQPLSVAARTAQQLLPDLILGHSPELLVDVGPRDADWPPAQRRSRKPHLAPARAKVHS